MKFSQANLRLGSARVSRALANVSFASRTAMEFNLFAGIVRRETRRTATGTVALPEHYAIEI